MSTPATRRTHNQDAQQTPQPLVSSWPSFATKRKRQAGTETFCYWQPARRHHGPLQLGQAMLAQREMLSLRSQVRTTCGGMTRANALATSGDKKTRSPEGRRAGKDVRMNTRPGLSSGKTTGPRCDRFCKTVSAWPASPGSCYTRPVPGRTVPGSPSAAQPISHRSD
jgi:hypothetical protein